jgi:betaine-homocysteine S-methyltransferase
MIFQYFRNIEEMVWAIEHVKEYGKIVAATMCVGPKGDEDGVSVAECAIRMAKAGADLVGINCLYDPFVILESMKVMKEALDNEGLKPHLMCQPLGFRVPDAGHFGWLDVPEYPYALEPRQITRIEAAKYARAAYDLGIR